MSTTKKQKTRAVADSIKQAAAMLGSTVAAVKAAKAQGCPGFRGSRVDVEEVRQWLKETPQDERESGDLPAKELLERLRLRAQVRKIDFACARDEGLYELKTQVHADMTRIQHAMRNQLSTLIQIAPTWSGMDACEIETRAREFFSEFCELASDLTSKIYQPTNTTK